MANVEGTFYSATTQRRGVTPVSPPNAVDDPVDPVSPPIGSHPPVTIGTPANGLSIVPSSQVLSIGLASSGVTGALSGTDWNTFNGKLNLSSLLTGYVVGANTALADTDTILGAFQKVQGQINARMSGTIASGQVAFGTGVNTIGGDSGLIWSTANRELIITRGTAGKLLTLNFAGGGNWMEFRNSNVIMGYLGQGNSLISGGSIEDLAIRTVANLVFATGGGTERWRITSTGILQSNGAQTIQTSTGNLTLATGAGNGNILLTPHGTGLVMIGSGTPTNTLDVNGTTRIRTISNLGTAATSVLVPSATGVVSLRTLAEFRGDLGATTLGANLFTIPNPSAITFPRFNADNTVSALSAGDFRTAIGAVPTTRTITINGVAQDLSADRSWTIPTHDAVTLGTANGLSLVGQALSLGLASSGVTGALSGTDWNTFNGKQNAISGTQTEGFVATIVGGVPTWAASAASKWTDVGSDIYRNSRVLVGATSFVDSTARLEVLGDIRVGTNGTGSTGTIRSQRELVLRQDGDQFGSSILRLRNRNDEAGVIYEITNLEVIDFIFKTPTIQRNIRLENRVGNSYLSVPEWQIGGTILNPTLIIADIGIKIRNGKNLVFDTATGTRIGTSNTQKLAFWNATPIAQPTNVIAAAAFVANTSGIVDDTATYGGYKIGQIVQALRDTGLLA